MVGVLTERLPQRFKFKARGESNDRFGVCFPNTDGTWTATTSDGMACEFDDCPWDVLGQMVGDCVDFAWIDRDARWHE